MSPASETARPAARIPRRVAVLVLACALFAVSGSAGLVYEVAWKHVFTTVFGSTTYAVSVVISVFMGGLALGSFVFGKVADRSRRPLLVFAVLQLGIGASGALVPHALRAAEGLYGPVFRASGSPAALTLVQVAVSAAILLVPTFLMGGTLPVLSRFAAEVEGRVGSAVGILYGLNTLGAAGGAFLAGFALIKAFGTTRTVYLAAGANLALAAVFALLHAWASPRAAPQEGAAAAPAPPALERRRAAVLLAMVAVSGFVSFSYEVLWTRLLSFRFETTVYAFSVMLATFLLGLGLGGALVGLLHRRRPAADYWRIYGYLEAGVGVSALATVLLFFSARRGYGSFAARVLGEFGVSALIMLVPTTLMGAAFPIACDLYARGVRQTGRSVGRIYLVNTAGAIAGALATGFVLVRAIGTQGAMALASALMVAMASVVLLYAPGRRTARTLAPVGAAWACVLGLWLLTPADFLRDYFLKNQSVALSREGRAVSLLDFAEGVEGVVVVCDVEGGDRTIATGSTDVAGTIFTLRNTQKLQAHVPMLLHPEPREVLQVGFGSGETAHLFTRYEPDRFDCVEISRAVIEMADAHFRSINGGVVEHPLFNAIVMDGAAYLKYTSRKYDVIANDSIYPDLAGNSALYTLEYFRNGRRHLKPGGIMTSWLPLEMPLRDFKTLLKTFHEVFPHVYVWSALSHRNKHALVIGSERPLRLDAARVLERFDRFARDDLAGIYLDDPAAFLGCHLASMDGMEPDLRDVPLNTEDLPILQFSGSRPEVYQRAARRTMSAGPLRLLLVHRDRIADRLEGLEAAGGEAFAERLGAMFGATSHLLRAFIALSEDPATAAAQMAAARELAPAHPAFLVQRRLAAEGERAGPASPAELSREALEAEAANLLRARRFRAAAAAFEEWARRRPDSADAHVGLGLALLEMGEPRQAARHLERAADLDPDLFGPRFALGVAYLRGGQPAAAIASLERAVQIDAGSAAAHAQLGTACAVAGDTTRALEHLGRAVELDPESAFALGNLARVLRRAGRPQEALPHLEKLARLRPDSARAHRMLAELYGELGDEEAARRHMERAERLEGPGSRAGEKAP